MTSGSVLDSVAVALDTSDRAEFQRWCRLFGGRVGVLKVGLEAFCRWGPWALEEARAHAERVLADLKLHDIPHTVGRSVAAVRESGVELLTVHAGGGSAVLRAAADAAGGEMTLLAVTVLTHLDDGALDRLDLPGSVAERALSWARAAREAGCGGAVCSPREVAVLRRGLGEDVLLVTPGVRLQGSAVATDDQRRTATPAEAIAAGADLLVIGRPLTRAPDPERALEELEEALQGRLVSGAF